MSPQPPPSVGHSKPHVQQCPQQPHVSPARDEWRKRVERKSMSTGACKKAKSDVEGVSMSEMVDTERVREYRRVCATGIWRGKMSGQKGEDGRARD